MDQNGMTGLEIAIIGMTGRFPGAQNIDEFWNNLKQGIDSISHFSDEEMRNAGVSLELLQNPNYVNAGGVIDDIDLFDAAFFQYSPREAEIMDPQHRILLECAWEALEISGYDPARYPGQIGVFVGSSFNTYLFRNLSSNPEIIQSQGEFQTILNNQNDHLATRISYQLNLRGPSVTIQTACSTSLVAVHFACQSLLSGESDMALAGGVSLVLPQKQGYLFQEGGILSPSGRCAAFDADADGTVGGSGIGLVVLKRLEDAINDRDHIWAVIKGSAINNDGSHKVGYTAPSVEGQMEVIRMAQAAAEVHPEQITYIEAHGTGTTMGDPIEFAALDQVFRSKTEKKNFCALGSVKTNIGHLDIAAGVTGLIKTALSIHHQQIPPSLHFHSINPNINIDTSSFFVNSKLIEWRSVDPVRYAGVSSFGMGGTNAHVILQDAPILEKSTQSRPWQLILLSAKTENALDRMTSNLSAYLDLHPELSLSDVAYTLLTGRHEFAHRRFAVIPNQGNGSASQHINEIISNQSHSKTCENKKNSIVFMFTGQGSQYPGMTYGLYQHETVFRTWIDRCADILGTFMELDIRKILYPDVDKNQEKMHAFINETEIAQPLLFVIEYALAQLWMSWGIKPDAMIGHSLGEYVAACLAEVFTLEDGLRIIVERGRFMQSTPEGKMMIVSLSEEELFPLIADRKISLSVMNSPEMQVVAGTRQDLESFEQVLVEKNIAYTYLPVNRAFHTSMMDSVIEPFTRKIEKISFSSPKVPFISNGTGTWITDTEAQNPEYWGKHIRNPVYFSKGIDVLLKEKNRILIEMGPGKTLTTLVRQQRNFDSSQMIVSSLGSPHEKKDDQEKILHSLGTLWITGIKIDWNRFYENEKRDKVTLPAYPFERQSFWISENKVKKGKQSDVLQKNRNIDDWLYVPYWTQYVNKNIKSSLPDMRNKNCLLFCSNSDLDESIKKFITQQCQNVIVIHRGKAYNQNHLMEYQIDPTCWQDYISLFRQLKDNHQVPDMIIHAWSLLETDIPNHNNDTNDINLEVFYSLVYIAKSILELKIAATIQFHVLTTHLFLGREDHFTNYSAASILGACIVIPQEIPSITVQCIEMDSRYRDECQINFEKIYQSFFDPDMQKITRFDGYDFWYQDYKKITIQDTQSDHSLLRNQGVYLITGGLGQIGLQLAKTIAKTVRSPKIILTTHSDFPERDQWETWLTLHNPEESKTKKIEKLLMIEKQGADIEIFQVDCTKENEMKNFIMQIVKKYRSLNGIIHSIGLPEKQNVYPIQDITKKECENIINTKLQSIDVLEKATEEIDLDFCFINSSLSSILGGLGFVAYAAANSIVDSYVLCHNRKSKIKWFSVNWDGWSFTENKQIKLSMNPDEGSQLFLKIVTKHNLYQIFVSTGNLDERLSQWRSKEYLKNNDNHTLAQRSLVSHKNNLNLPNNDVQKVIAAIWEELLGIENVGIYDNFFDLGGQSILLMQLFSRIQSIFSLNISIKKLFTYPTIAAIAECILSMENDNKRIAKIAAIRVKIDSMSPEEIQSNLKSKKSESVSHA